DLEKIAVRHALRDADEVPRILVALPEFDVHVLPRTGGGKEGPQPLAGRSALRIVRRLRGDGRRKRRQRRAEAQEQGIGEETNGSFHDTPQRRKGLTNTLTGDPRESLERRVPSGSAVVNAMERHH